MDSLRALRSNVHFLAGCDGLVNVWDMVNKKRLYQTPVPYPTSVAALAFSPNGSMLAVASSYTFEQVLR